MITTFDHKINRDTVIKIIDKTLADLDIPGVQVRLESGVYTNTTLRMKLEAAIVDNNGHVHSTSSKEWKSHCTRWGFKESDMGKRFLLHDRIPVILTGCKVSRYKYPLDIKRIDNGTKYKCGVRDLTLIES